MPTIPADKLRLVWSRLEKLGTLLSLLIVLALLLGFRIDKPSERIAKLEIADSLLAARLTKHEKDQDKTSVQVDVLFRLRCLSMTRAQAILVNACDGYKTAEDTMGRGRR